MKPFVKNRFFRVALTIVLLFSAFSYGFVPVVPLSAETNQMEDKQVTSEGTLETTESDADIDTTNSISIQDAKSKIGETVTIEGVVTTDNLAAPDSTQLSTYIQDDGAGINVFHYDLSNDLAFQPGDKVRITGKIEVYNGLTEIIPNHKDSVTVIASNQPIPNPKQITIKRLQNEARSEPLEGQLVSVTGYIDNIPTSPAGGGYNITFIDDEFHSTTLRVMEDTIDIESLQEGAWYDVTAVLGQYDRYQLLPRDQADIKKASEQSEAPTPSKEHTATVASVTDGDTIRLEEPVLGSDRVRFVNIDTPETSVSGSEGVDEENQKQHGDKATEYLQSLLEEGEQVKLKLGEQPTDEYGRLLAEVINEEGVNTNIEMVEEGYAVTYFIWPFADEKTYDQYQSAVQQAYESEKGIWNPTHGLKQLPFEYRAMTEGGDFHRYVGHSETKTYVEPLDWEDVPVAKRIFFASAEEAESAGYQPLEENESDESYLDVQLLGMNDLHGKIDQEYELDITGDGETDGTFGRMDYVSAYLKERDQQHPHSRIIHAGDMIGGSSPVSGLFQDEPTVEILEEIGFDYGTVGNHEFDEGTDELLRMVNGGEHPEELGTDHYDGMDFQNLCANCVYKDSGETILPPYAIETIDGEKIGFIGVNTQASAGMVMPAGIEDIEFTDEVTAVNESVADLKAEGVEAIVVLAHLPASQEGNVVTGDSAHLAKQIDDEVDVIFAAHNHQVINGEVDDKLIVQASEYGKAFSDVDLRINRDSGDIVEKEAEIVFVDQSSVDPDPAVTDILSGYADKIESRMNQVIGYNGQDLTGDYSNTGDHGLGNVIADSMRWTMGDADFALMNGGGIRDDLLQGDITWGDLYNIMPFGNTLMKLEIQGKDLYPILNAQLSPTYGPDYSVSGLHYKWDESENKVTDITFPNGEPIDGEAMYTLVVNNYMGTSQGEKYRPIGELGSRPQLGPLDIDALVDYMKQLNTTADNPLQAGPEGRIVAVDGAEEEDAEDEHPTPGQGDNENEQENPEKKEHLKVSTSNANGQVRVEEGSMETIAENGTVIVDIEDSVADIILTKQQVEMLKEKSVLLSFQLSDVTVDISSSEFPLEEVNVQIQKRDDVRDANQAISDVYDFSINGGEVDTFTTPVTLRFSVDEMDRDNTNLLAIYHYNESDNKWERMGGDYQNGVISADTNHFSTFAVFASTSDQVDDPNGQETDTEEETEQNEANTSNKTQDDTEQTEQQNSATGEQDLPDTATNMFTILLAGSLMIIAGISFRLWSKRERM
ncbi:hypothetical protein J416_04071 [Gracilibacillus halophilus YIM-C55.5]|uniref:TNase-like domain-containing protein n=1 Tax=Gracilibacillus halophilus YIM-C55.5 TaxID=1308866 RepID=N4WNJ8_9BACI|nr:5'-nucleotidase C-terminal domain-containing protein [Gracilibacillus halophilus]ENH97712.1 hypothetical protein J416_04071 [Gracilibacillus halophilus YIM-C55.5]